MRTNKRLGQHFLFDPSILSAIVDAADLSPDDTVVEIGPGPGTLTRLLSAKVKNVTAIELDDALYERLRRELIGYMNVDLVHDDALRFPFETCAEFKVVANIPYYITTPIIFRLLETGRNLRSMTLTIQKEVAQRIVAKPGGKDYGVLTIMVQYRTEPVMRFIVPREAFKPAPKVDSAVVHMKIRPQPAVAVDDEALFFRIIRTAFSQRRKTLANSLRAIDDDIKGIISGIGIDPVRRPETLSIEEFALLADAVKKSQAT